jgi:hypothetical protein
MRTRRWACDPGETQGYLKSYNVLINLKNKFAELEKIGKIKGEFVLVSKYHAIKVFESGGKLHLFLTAALDGDE